MKHRCPAIVLILIAGFCQSIAFRTAHKAVDLQKSRGHPCSTEAWRQVFALNFKSVQEKQSGRAYVKCQVDDPEIEANSMRYKISCKAKDCKPSQFEPQTPGQSGWCFVPDHCGGKSLKIKGFQLSKGKFAPPACTPLKPSEIPTCRGAEPVEACPASCRDPECVNGSPNMEGHSLVGGRCMNYCSKVVGGERYCGEGDTHKEGVDCRGCATAAPDPSTPVELPDSEPVEEPASEPAEEPAEPELPVTTGLEPVSVITDVPATPVEEPDSTLPEETPAQEPQTPEFPTIGELGPVVPAEGLDGYVQPLHEITDHDGNPGEPFESGDTSVFTAGSSEDDETAEVTDDAPEEEVFTAGSSEDDPTWLDPEFVLPVVPEPEVRDPRGEWVEEWKMFVPWDDSDGEDSEGEDSDGEEETDTPEQSVQGVPFEMPPGDDTVVLIMEVKSSLGPLLQGVLVEVMVSDEVVGRSEPTGENGQTQIRIPKSGAVELKAYHPSNKVFPNAQYKDFSFAMCQGKEVGCEVLMTLNPKQGS